MVRAFLRFYENWWRSLTPTEPRRHLQKETEFVIQARYILRVRGYESSPDPLKSWLYSTWLAICFAIAMRGLACYQGICDQAFRLKYNKQNQLLFEIDYTCPVLKRWRPPAASSGCKSSLYVISPETSPRRPSICGSKYVWRMRWFWSTLSDEHRWLTILCRNG